MSYPYSSNGYLALTKGGYYTGADGESTLLAQELFIKCIINYFQHDELGWLTAGPTQRKSFLSPGVIRLVLHTLSPNCHDLTKRNTRLCAAKRFSISWISKCICYKLIAGSEPSGIQPVGFDPFSHTFGCTPTLMPSQAGGNGFFTWSRRPATFHAAPHPPNRRADVPIHIHTGGAGQQWQNFTYLASPSSHSATPTSQLSSPNTLRSISAPCEWFIDYTSFR